MKGGSSFITSDAGQGGEEMLWNMTRCGKPPWWTELPLEMRVRSSVRPERSGLGVVGLTLEMAGSCIAGGPYHPAPGSAPHQAGVQLPAEEVVAFPLRTAWALSEIALANDNSWG